MRSPIQLTLTLALAGTLAACGNLLGAEEAGGDTAAKTLVGSESGSPAPAPAPAAMAMGNNSSSYANDGECDDPRFSGNAMAEGLLTDNIGKDATDCQRALEAGVIHPDPLFATPASDAEIVYGDDSGDYTNDGECDDIRFTGAYADTMIYIVDDIGHDATDCRNAVQSGEARWQGNTATPHYGSDG